MARDYYDVLGVSRDADPDELQQAFRRLARRNHPDVNRDPGAEERFKEINEAYSVLSDPKQRKKYDRFGEDFRQIPDDWEERIGAGAGGGRRGGGRGRAASAGVPAAVAGPRGRRVATPVRTTSTSAAGASGVVSVAGSTSRTCSAACSAVAPGAGQDRWPGPIRRRSCRSPSRRPTAAAVGRSPSTGRTARAPTRSRSRPGSPRAGGSGWPGRAAGGWATVRPATST